MKALAIFVGGIVAAFLACAGVSLAAVTMTTAGGSQAERIPIYFPAGPARLTDDAGVVLDETAKEAQEGHAVRVVVIGYGTGVESEADRASTASARAKLIEQALVQRGLDPKLLYVMAAATASDTAFSAPSFIADRRAEVVIERGTPGL